jgi:hypothetical protein
MSCRAGRGAKGLLETHQSGRFLGPDHISGHYPNSAWNAALLTDLGLEYLSITARPTTFWRSKPGKKPALHSPSGLRGRRSPAPARERLPERLRVVSRRLYQSRCRSRIRSSQKTRSSLFRTVTSAMKSALPYYQVFRYPQAHENTSRGRLLPSVNSPVSER